MQTEIVQILSIESVYLYLLRPSIETEIVQLVNVHFISLDEYGWGLTEDKFFNVFLNESS